MVDLAHIDCRYWWSWQ